MKEQKRASDNHILESLFPNNSVSIIYDTTNDFTDQLINKQLVNSKFTALITPSDTTLLVPYLNVSQNMNLTPKNHNENVKRVISKLIYGHVFAHYLPNFVDKKITTLTHTDKTFILLFRTILNANNIVILSDLIDDFSIVETRYFIDLVTELSLQLDLRIIITTTQSDLLVQPQVIPFANSPIPK